MTKPPSHRTLRESAVFSAELDTLPTSGPVASALDGLLWGISIGPDKFSVIPDSNPDLYLAKTDDHRLTDGTLIVWFEIVDANVVELKYLDFVPADPQETNDEEE